MVLSDVSFVKDFFAVAHSSLMLASGNQVDFMYQDIFLLQQKSQLSLNEQ